MNTTNQTNLTLQFEQATVIFTNDLSQATGKQMPMLKVQAIDAYGYQREWSCGLRHEPGDSKDLYWESHVYQHPGRRESCRLSSAVAVKLINRFLDLCQDYPGLLFNGTGEHTTNAARPRCEGFVRFCEQMHRGAVPSVKML